MAEIRSSTEDRVAPPLVVDDPSRFAWDNEADVIVVGFGGAGLSAAIQARESGAGVIAIDRFAGGGATRYSGGVYYAGGGTKYQREGGVNDTPEEMFKYLRAEGTPLTDATLRRLCERSVADFEWIEAHGVPFAGNPYFKKTAYPPHPHYLYYSGNEAWISRARHPADIARWSLASVAICIMKSCPQWRRDSACVSSRIHPPDA